MGTGAGVGMCGVTEHNAGSVGGVVAVVCNMVFPSPSSWENFSSDVVLITLDVTFCDASLLRCASLHRCDRRKKKEDLPVVTDATEEANNNYV